MWTSHDFLWTYPNFVLYMHICRYIFKFYTWVLLSHWSYATTLIKMRNEGHVRLHTSSRYMNKIQPRSHAIFIFSDVHQHNIWEHKVFAHSKACSANRILFSKRNSWPLLCKSFYHYFALTATVNIRGYAGRILKRFCGRRKSYWTKLWVEGKLKITRDSVVRVWGWRQVYSK